MLRVLTSIIRNAPGPFKGARTLTADLIEGLVDVIVPQAEMEQTSPPEPLSPTPPRVEETPAIQEPVSVRDEPEEKKAAETSSDLAAAFRIAIKRPKWVRRQDFKVLAIFWDSKQKGNGAITAKVASSLGDDLELKIRHENVRKVVRTRLTDKIETTTVPDSQPPTYQYQITDLGIDFFEKEYLRNLDLASVAK